MFDCVGIGINAVDYICLLSDYPELDQKRDAEQFSYQGGGPVPTALVTLARFGAKTSYIGVVGDDENGRYILDQFKRENVDVSAVIVDKNCHTNQAFIWVDKNSGKKAIVLNNDTSLAPLIPDEISVKHITSTKYLHVDGRETEATMASVKLAKKAGAEIVLDAGSPRKDMKKLLQLVDYPIVSQNFCHSYLNTDHYEEGLEKLLKAGAKAAVITCGESGSHASDGTGIYHQPAFEVDVIDTTGAGDVYHGAFIYGLLQKWTLPEIIKFAAATAALKCTQIGGRPGIPDLPQVIKFIVRKENHK